MTTNFHHDSDRVMTNEQFTEVVGAILEGKYSWACVLILKFSGFNPLHYIPYRTYNRLMKDNCPRNSRRNQSLNTQNKPKSEKVDSSIRDLTYLEVIEKKSQKVKGGTHAYCDQTPWRLFA